MRTAVAGAALFAASLAAPTLACDGLRGDAAWVRLPPPTVGHAAAYLELRNEGRAPVIVRGASSPAFAHAMLHETRFVDGHAEMRHLAEITVRRASDTRWHWRRPPDAGRCARPTRRRPLRRAGTRLHRRPGAQRVGRDPAWTTMTAARLFILLQAILPQHGLSRLIGWLSRCEGGQLTRIAIRAFTRVYGVELDEAEQGDAGAYPSFNAFFTRRLRAGARPLEADPRCLACPADGRISELGPLEAGSLLQAKGLRYSLLDLCDGDRTLAARFAGGSFLTVYLAPRDYHRVHMPATGQARDLRYVPGALFAVNATTTAALPNLFCRNERCLVSFESASGTFALVMVGALNVGSIALELPSPTGFHNRPEPNWEAGRTHALDGQTYARGAEFGRFNLGSTVILLASRGCFELDPALRAGLPVRVGQTIGRLPAAP